MRSKKKNKTSSIASKQQKRIEMHTPHTWLRLVASSLKNKNFRSSSRILSYTEQLYRFRHDTEQLKLLL